MLLRLPLLAWLPSAVNPSAWRAAAAAAARPLAATMAAFRRWRLLLQCCWKLAMPEQITRHTCMPRGSR